MNFFENQERARKETQKLATLFALAVLATAFFVSLALTYIIHMEDMEFPPTSWFFVTDPIFLVSLAAVSLIIFACSFFKTVVLGVDGNYVAKASGATPVDLNTKDFHLSRYNNIVEEMSIASGTPVPEIYVMEKELSINAFAAGHDINNAVIAVTRGALLKLNRDELQAVVAHEFSHIFNGDMKINIRLIGYLFGLMTIFEIGRILIRSSGRNKKKSDGGHIGLAFLVIGGIGWFFGSLIKASISRQREYLADASSVQYTRNPNGITGALKKLMIADEGSKINSPEVGEVSHMFFGEALSSFAGLFATHPPLEKRILEVEPGFKLKKFEAQEKENLVKEMIDVENQKEESVTKIKNRTNTQGQIESGPLKNNLKILGDLDKITGDIGQLAILSLEGALNLSKGSDEEVLSSIYSFLLNLNPKNLESGLKGIEASYSTRLKDKIKGKLSEIGQIELSQRMTYMELLIPRLKKLDSKDKSKFLETCRQLVLSDKTVTFDEFVYYTFLRFSLEARGKRKLHFTKILKSKELLLNTLKEEYIKKEDYKEFHNALNIFRNAGGKLKESFLKDALEIIEKDNQVSVKEFEILRLITHIIDVPMPPLSS